MRSVPIKGPIACKLAELIKGAPAIWKPEQEFCERGVLIKTIT